MAINRNIRNVKKEKSMSIKPKLIGTVALGVFGLIVVAAINPFTTISSGHAGILTDWGSVQQVALRPGLHVTIPVYQSIAKLSTQPQSFSSTESAATRDQQEVTTSVSMIYHVPTADAPAFYSNFRSFQVFQSRVSSYLSADLKAVTTNYNAEELITKRLIVDTKIKDLVIQSMAPYNIVVDAVNIANFQFSPRYMQSIEDKQIAQQQALKEKYVLQQAQIDAQKQVVTAKAKAEAVIAAAKGNAEATLINAKATAKAYEIKSNSITPQILKLQAIKQWNGILPTYLGSGAPVPFLNSGKN